MIGSVFTKAFQSTVYFLYENEPRVGKIIGCKSSLDVNNIDQDVLINTYTVLATAVNSDGTPNPVLHGSATYDVSVDDAFDTQQDLLDSIF